MLHANVYVCFAMGGQEWDRSWPGQRPDIFPQFSPMKTPLPQPLPADPPEEDEEEDDKKEEEGGGGGGGRAWEGAWDRRINFKHMFGNEIWQKIVGQVSDALIFCSQLFSISTLGNHFGRKMIQLGFEMSEKCEEKIEPALALVLWVLKSERKSDQIVSDWVL